MKTVHRTIQWFALAVGLTSLGLALARTIYSADPESLIRLLVGTTAAICLALVFLIMHILNEDKT